MGVENVGGNSSGAGPTSLTQAFTVTAANLLLVGVSIGDGGAIDTIVTGVTWNTTGTLSAVSSSTASDGVWSQVKWFRLDSPAAATANVVVSCNGGGMTPDQIAMHIIGVTNYDSGTGLRAASTTNNTSANPSLTVAASQSGDLVVAAVSNDNEGGNTVQAGSLIFEAENVGSDTDHSSQYVTATGANTVMAWTQSGNGNGWAASGIPVPITGGGGGGATLGSTFDVGNALEGRTFAGILRRNATIFLPSRKLVIARHLPKAA